jgi:hypothetical protein
MSFQPYAQAIPAGGTADSFDANEDPAVPAK